MNIHYPRVRIITPAPTVEHPVAPAWLTTVEIDGQQWPVVGYMLENGGPHDRQQVTLTFHADVTVEHK